MLQKKKPDAKQLRKIWMKSLKSAAEEILMAAVTGQQLTQELIDVQLSLPQPLVEGMRKAAAQSGLEVKELFANIAADIFQQSMTAELPVGNNLSPTEDFMSKASLNNPSAGLDEFADQMKGMTDKLEEFKKLVGVFEGLGEVIKNGTIGNGEPDNSGKTP